MWDAAFYSPSNLQQVLQRQAHVLGRLSWSLKPHLLRILPDGSFLTQLPIGRSGRNHQRQWGPTVRIIEYQLRGLSTKHRKHRLVTTLLDEALFPAMELAELYHRRWELELAINELETHQLQQRVLVSQTPAGVVQEVAGLLIAHWLLRRLMCEAANTAKVVPTRISFVVALKLLRCRLPRAIDALANPGQWWRNLVNELALEEVIEPRRRRINPRVLKRTTYDFRKKRACDKSTTPPLFTEAFAILR